MAKVLFGPIVSEARNAQGTLVFSRNTYGAFTRTRVTPANPNTVYQQNARTGFKELTKYWSQLTDAQRAAWRAWAPSHPFVDRFGNAQIFSAFGAFVQWNMTLAWWCEGVAMVLKEPPADPTVATLTALAIDADLTAGHLWVSFAPSPVPTDHNIILFGTQQLPAGVNFFGAWWRWFGNIGTARTSPQDKYAQYNDKFAGPYTAGKRIAVKAYTLRWANGAVGPSLIATDLIT